MPAKVETTPPLPRRSPVADKPLIARFDGGQLSSDGGLLALREFERRLGIVERLAACIDDPRAPERVRNSVAAILRFRMLMIAAGYEDGNDADNLRHDPRLRNLLATRRHPVPVPSQEPCFSARSMAGPRDETEACGPELTVS